VIEIKSEIHQCICKECSSQQTEQLIYDKIACNNILHAFLTVVTGILQFVWIYKRRVSKKETDHNRRLSLSSYWDENVINVVDLRCCS